MGGVVQQRLRIRYESGVCISLCSAHTSTVPISSDDQVYNLTLVSKTSTDVTLSWSAVNMTQNSTFRAEVSSGTQSYVIANTNSTLC